MDRQNQAKALLPIIQALAEGKKIQYSFNGTTWLEEDMDFELSTICNDICAGSCDYRIKPEDCSTCMFKEGSCYPNTTIFDKDKRCKGYQPEEDYELPEPFNEKKYRPFKDCNELIEHFMKMNEVELGNTSIYYPQTYKPCICVKHKRYGTENLIIAFDNDNESIGGSCVFIQDMWVDMQELFDNFTFLDGSPCGIK